MKNKNIKGFFKVKDNDLIYYPQIKEKDKFHHSLTVCGKWRLNKNNNLIFDVEESYSAFFGRRISFDTKVENASKDSLSVSLSRRITSKLKAKNNVTFQGRWKADKYNNLIFEIKRSEQFDELVFGSSWKVTPKNQIEFFYKKKFFKKQIINSFTLTGSWRLCENTLFFSLDDSSQKELAFSLALGRKLLFNKQSVDFLIGAKSDSKKKISLFGKCKFANDTLEFSADPQAKNRALIFRYRRAFGKDKEASLELINKKGKPLGFEIAFSKNIFNDAKLFLKITNAEEKKVEAGFYLPF